MEPLLIICHVLALMRNRWPLRTAGSSFSVCLSSAAGVGCKTPVASLHIQLERTESRSYPNFSRFLVSLQSYCLSLPHSMYLSIYLSVCMSVSSSIHPPIHPSIHPSIYLCQGVQSYVRWDFYSGVLAIFLCYGIIQLKSKTP